MSFLQDYSVFIGIIITLIICIVLIWMYGSLSFLGWVILIGLTCLAGGGMFVKWRFGGLANMSGYDMSGYDQGYDQMQMQQPQYYPQMQPMQMQPQYPQMQPQYQQMPMQPQPQPQYQQMPMPPQQQYQ